MLPARGEAVSDTTPAISAVVSDPETEVNEENVAVYMDGKKFSGTWYAYDPNTDRPSGTNTRLSKGESHTFKVVPSDGDGQKTTRFTRFLVRRWRMEPSTPAPIGAMPGRAARRLLARALRRG